MTNRVKSEFIRDAEQRAIDRKANEQRDAHVKAHRDALLIAPELERVKQRTVRPPATVEKTLPPAVIEHRLMQDPSMTDAEYFHQRQAKSGPNVGKVYVQMNMAELIGGLARLKGVSEMQIMAAAKYRNAYDRAQIGSARAVDYAAVKVDTSGPRGDVLDAGRVDALDDYARAVRCLGMMRSMIVE